MRSIKVCSLPLFMLVLAMPEAKAAEPVLEEIIVTAQKREESLQDSALSVMAVTGESLEKGRNLSFSDLARSVTGFSYTGNSLFDQELNVRGITTTRLDSPSADPSVGVFVDGVYVGRPGLMNMDMFDVERVEVVRGPQGVLMGKNVVGGALTIINRAPEEKTSGAISVGVGNHAARRATGYITGALGDGGWSGRLSFQHQSHNGYARDVLNNRDMEDLDSTQFRGQLQYGGDRLTARFTVETYDDESNGPASIALDSPTVDHSLEAHVRGREMFGQLRGAALNIRETSPSGTTFFGDSSPSFPISERDGVNFVLDIGYDISENLELNSITGLRDAEGYNFYDQTGISVEALQAVGLSDPLASPVGLFREPVTEREEVQQFSQELRLTYDNPESNLDWIVGVYYQDDKIDKFDRFQGSTPWSLAIPPFGVLNGQSEWDNRGNNASIAVFAQVGYRFNEQWKLTVGGRYTKDEKDGHIIATNVTGGGLFAPADPLPLTPLVDAAGYSVSYDQDWSEFTPQAILEWEPNDDMLLYFSATKGFKGGGWEDTPPNALATNGDAAFDPEFVKSFELGMKREFMDRRARLNAALFLMDYDDLQVTQTNDACLCNITDNAASAEIKGVEVEFTMLATEALLLWVNTTFLDAEYEDFLESSGLDNSGNVLQRSPEYQYNVGAELTLNVGDWEDALSFRVNYAHQDEIAWLPGNNEFEDDYGLLDARISLAPMDAGWSVSIWGKNVTDEEYRNHVIPFWGQDISFYAPPRTYGIEFGMQF